MNIRFYILQEYRLGNCVYFFSEVITIFAFFIDFFFSPSAYAFIRKMLQWSPTQPTVTCSKLTIETLEQGVKYVQS